MYTLTFEMIKQNKKVAILIALEVTQMLAPSFRSFSERNPWIWGKLSSPWVLEMNMQGFTSVGQIEVTYRRIHRSYCGEEIYSTVVPLIVPLVAFPSEPRFPRVSRYVLEIARLPGYLYISLWHTYQAKICYFSLLNPVLFEGPKGSLWIYKCTLNMDLGSFANSQEG